jgi:hypothetical protein
MKDYKGAKYRIIHCEGARESFKAELDKHVPKSKHESYKARMVAIIKRLGDGHAMSNENFPKEGELPDKSHFRALKKIPLRAYVWQSKKTAETYYISHYVYKNYDKLKESDTKKVCDNWRALEK